MKVLLLIAAIAMVGLTASCGIKGDPVALVEVADA
jgi:hypothetical protein